MLVFHLQGKVRTKSEMSAKSKESKSRVRGSSKEGEAVSSTTSTVDISGDEGGDDGEDDLDGDAKTERDMEDSSRDIAEVEEQIRLLDLSLEKLHLEFQQGLDAPKSPR